MKEKLILFDWGNIVESHLTGFSGYDAWDELFNKCGSLVSGKTIYNKLGKYHLSAITNYNDLEDVYNDIKEEFNLKVSFQEFIKLYKEIFDKIDYYPEVRDYEHSLKERCKIGILSNLLICDKERLDKEVDLSKYDYVFLSFEIGYRKPDIRIFEYVQSKLPFLKEDILFIDDRKDNIETAKNFGWNVYQTTGLELDEIKTVCEEFLNR